MQAVILAGGKGTRLKERLGGLPKPLINICGIPLLGRQILLLKSYGFNNILLLVNYASNKIFEFCNQNDNWGIEITCIDDGGEPLGTAGAVLNIYNLLESEFLVVYGDTMLDVDLNRFYSYHHQDLSSAATLFLHPNDHPVDSDLVEIDEKNQVIGFFPYPHDPSKYHPNLVNAALYWIKKECLFRWKDNKGMLDFGKDLFPALLKENFKIRGYNSTEYIKDAGTPDRVDKINEDFKNKKIQKLNLQNSQKAIFVDRDGTINFDVHFLSNLNEFELIPGAIEALRKINVSDYLVCVVTNQPVIARGDCSYYELKQIHNKMETLLGAEGAYVDRIYYCPHHPDKGFIGEINELKIDCNCRKPKTGMIDRAVQELNIERDNSWMVGDTTSDMLTAKNAGLKSILVETGYAGFDEKYYSIPDYTVPDIYAAATFIIEVYPRIFDFCSKLEYTFKEGDTVLVGGLSRTGKTTFSNVLRDALICRNKNARVISLDRWLKSEEDRTEGVLGRYNLNEVEKLLNSVTNSACRPFKLNLPRYDKLSRKQTYSIDELEVQKNDIIILEGTIALYLKSENPDIHRVFVNIDENSRKKRVIKEYQLRGYSLDEAKKIYEDRQLDETPIIKPGNEYINVNINEFFNRIK